jgi:hypothetical protein
MKEVVQMLRRLCIALVFIFISLPLSVKAAEEDFVLSYMSEYAEEYKALIHYLEQHGDLHDLLGDDDSFLAHKAYPAFILADPLNPDSEINVTAMRWEIPTRKNKLLSLVFDKDSFNFLGIFVPDDEKWKSPYLIDVDIVAEVTAKIPNSSLIFIIAHQYGAAFVQVKSAEGTYLIPFATDEKMIGLTNGVLYDAKEALLVIDQKLPHIRSGEYAYNADGEPLYGGGGGVGTPSANPSASMFYLFLGIGAVLCLAAPFAIAKMKMKRKQS